MTKKTVCDLDVQNKKVIVRVDYNVPLENGVITDDTRIVKSLETIKYLLANNAAVILMSHLGRPKGKPNAEFSLRPIALHLQTLLGQEVLFAEDCVGEAAEQTAASLKTGQVLMLENLRFHAEEEKNDPDFSEKLASLAEIYVNDGFGVSHRAHASVEGITHFLPSVAGFLLEREIKFLGQILAQPERPFVAILGGAKVSDKIGVIDSFLEKVDKLLIGGGMANTFLKAQGYEIGNSLIEEDKVAYAKALLEKAQSKGVELLLPEDVVIADKFAPDAKQENCSVKEIKAGWQALDIGERTSKFYAQALQDARTIVWNGPMGVFEMDAFARGTEKVAQAVAATHAVSIVGGGDSVAAVEKLGLAEQITHISTGGGASLEYMEGKVLPGIAALDDLRQVLIAGNWKMNKTVSEALTLAQQIVEATFGVPQEVVIFPPYTALESVAEAIDGKHVGYGGQDLHWEDKGAFTGAISGAMLADIGCQYVLVGHSERRHIFGETNQAIAKKVAAAFRNQLVPVLCVGETEAERLNGETQKIILEQLELGLKDAGEKLIPNLVIAYEPVWAIGTGQTASSADAGEVCTKIRTWLKNKYGEDTSRRIRILYGGSVNEKNIGEFMQIEEIDGALVGGASLEAESFCQIVRY